MTEKHQTYVADTYNTRAEKYVESSVHASGEDLEQIKQILSENSQTSDANLLDLGCGGGHVSYVSAPFVHQVVACDISQNMLDNVRKTAKERNLQNITTEQASAEKLPFQDCSFDWIISRFSSHHWHNLSQGIQEMKRILKPQGKIILIDTISPLDKTADSHLQTIELLRDCSHVRNYNIAEYIELFSNHELQLTGITQRPLRLKFQSWTQRTQTSKHFSEAILTLQSNAPDHVKDILKFENDGSFTIPTATFILSN